MILRNLVLIVNFLDNHERPLNVGLLNPMVLIFSQFLNFVGTLYFRFLVCPKYPRILGLLLIY
jgi:hypothetical protein